MSQTNHPVPKPRLTKTEMISSKDVEPEYGTGVPTEPVEQNMGVDIKYLQATNQELVKQINLLKSEITALQNDLNKERVTNKERELQLLKRENELERATQQLKDERCDLVREHVRLQGLDDELTVLKKNLEHREFDLRNMESGEGEMSAHIASKERKLCEQEEALKRQEEALRRSKLEVDDSKLMLQQWEASLQQQRYELLMQQQQNERAIQQHWDQLKREYAMPQQPGYNVPAYGQRSSGYLPVHPPGPDMYPESRGTPIANPSPGKPTSTNAFAATNTIDEWKNYPRHNSKWDAELAVAINQEENDEATAYQKQLKLDEDYARMLQEQLLKEEEKMTKGQQGLAVVGLRDSKAPEQQDAGTTRL